MRFLASRLKTTKHVATSAIAGLTLTLTFGVLALGCTLGRKHSKLDPLYGHSLSYDVARDEVILFGGAGTDRVTRGETWIWNGSSWRKAEVEGPSPRIWPAMAYDPVSERVLLFGGRQRTPEAQTSLGDTWEWNGKRWRRLSTTGPPGRDHHKMAYDQKRHRMLLFGGWDGTAVRNDTWEWNGEEWKQVSDSGPAPRAAHGMVYDEERGTILLHGGRSPEEFFGDTWQWDGRQWIPLETHGPAARAFHALAYDSHLHRVVLFGGRDGPVLFGDTWQWDGRRWELIDLDGPSKRGVYSMVFNRQRRRVVFYGGGHRDQETQIWHLWDETWILTEERGWFPHNQADGQ